MARRISKLSRLLLLAALAPLAQLPSVAAAQGAARPASPRDTAQATVADATVLVDYGRPSMRGREIFGGLVPFDQVWRTGANAATTLVTDRDLQFGSTTVPAGTYTLYTLPTEKGAKLIINRQTGQWGTEYDQGQDLARIDLKATRTAQPVEQFEIAVVPEGKGGVLRLTWDRTQWTAPFTVR